MPKLFVHSTEGTFTSDARASIAAELTDLGIACEKLAHTAAIRDGVWVTFSEYPPASVFRGGRPATASTIVLEVYALEGGLDAESRTRLIAESTRILDSHATSTEDVVPTYVVINETPEADWGMLGKQVRLAALRSPA